MQNDELRIVRFPGVPIRPLPRFKSMPLFPLAVIAAIQRYLGARFGGVSRRLAHVGIGSSANT